MSSESSQGDQPSWHHHFHPAHQERSSARPTLLPPMRRRRRNAYDLRRPAATPAQDDDVIDLTNEPETPPQLIQHRSPESRMSSTARLPRFGRPILEQEVVDLEQEAGDPAEGPSSSPEVQFVSATVRPQPVRRWDPGDRWDPISLYNGAFPPQFAARARQYNQGMDSLPSLQYVPLRPPRSRHNLLPDDDTLFFGRDLLRPDTPENLRLDYEVTSFPFESPDQAENSYKAPSPAPEGFTRTLTEDDVAVCPNCNWELGTGEGKKEEIWVAKQCGHVGHQFFLKLRAIN